MFDALADLLPSVDRALPRVRLGDWPTPIEPHGLRDALWVKREDLSSPFYGGNKVRCLEPVIGALEARGVRRAHATGAWGSNQAVALAVHGARRGLATGAVLFPQPPSRAAGDNLRALLATDCAARLLPSIAAFPWVYAVMRRRGEVMIPPGAAVPLGAIGHVAGALEVAQSVAAGALPAPRHVVLAVGSTCTTAGLLVGFAVAARLGVGWTTPPKVHAVRVTPWPVTARRRIVGLALGAARLLAQLGGPDVADRAALSAGLAVSGSELGRGYGHGTRSGQAAIAVFEGIAGPKLDSTYAGKSGAWLIANLATLDGPTVFWATKSAVLPQRADDAALAGGSRRG